MKVGFPGGAVIENPPANAGNARDIGSIPRSERFSWSRKWQPTQVFLPGEFHGQRSLAGCSPWGRKESDMTVQRDEGLKIPNSGPSLNWGWSSGQS